MGKMDDFLLPANSNDFLPSDNIWKIEKLEQKISCMGNIFPNTADSNDQRLWQPQLLFNGGMPKAL